MDSLKVIFNTLSNLFSFNLLFFFSFEIICALNFLYKLLGNLNRLRESFRTFLQIVSGNRNCQEEEVAKHNMVAVKVQRNPNFVI